MKTKNVEPKLAAYAGGGGSEVIRRTLKDRAMTPHKETPPTGRKEKHDEGRDDRNLGGLIRDPDTNPTAKCTAIRTWLQIEGQEGPDELDAELDRLMEGHRSGD